MTDNNREIVNKDLVNEGRLTSKTAYRSIEIMERYASYENAYKLPETYASIDDMYQNSSGDYYIRGDTTSGDSYVAKFNSSWEENSGWYGPSISGTVTDWFFSGSDVYVVGTDGGNNFIQKINGTSGTAEWRSDVTGNITGIKFDGSDVYVVGDNGGNSFVRKHDGTTGNWASQTDITGSITDIRIYGSNVYINGQDGGNTFVEILNDTNGNSTWRETVNDYRC